MQNIIFVVASVYYLFVRTVKTDLPLKFKTCKILLIIKIQRSRVCFLLN